MGEEVAKLPFEDEITAAEICSPPQTKSQGESKSQLPLCSKYLVPLRVGTVDSEDRNALATLYEIVAS